MRQGGGGEARGHGVSLVTAPAHRLGMEIRWGIVFTHLQGKGGVEV